MRNPELCQLGTRARSGKAAERIGLSGSLQSGSYRGVAMGCRSDVEGDLRASGGGVA